MRLISRRTETAISPTKSKKPYYPRMSDPAGGLGQCRENGHAEEEKIIPGK